MILSNFKWKIQLSPRLQGCQLTRDQDIRRPGPRVCLKSKQNSHNNPSDECIRPNVSVEVNMVPRRSYRGKAYAYVKEETKVRTVVYKKVRANDR